MMVAILQVLLDGNLKCGMMTWCSYHFDEDHWTIKIAQSQQLKVSLHQAYFMQADCISSDLLLLAY